MRDDLNTQNFSVPKIAHDLLSPWISCGTLLTKLFGEFLVNKYWCKAVGPWKTFVTTASGPGPWELIGR